MKISLVPKAEEEFKFEPGTVVVFGRAIFAAFLFQRDAEIYVKSRKFPQDYEIRKVAP